MQVKNHRIHIASIDRNLYHVLGWICMLACQHCKHRADADAAPQYNMCPETFLTVLVWEHAEVHSGTHMSLHVHEHLTCVKMS